MFADLYMIMQKLHSVGLERKIQVGDIVTIYVSGQLLQFSKHQHELKESKLGGNVENSWEQIGNILGNETLKQTKNTSSWK